MHQRDRLKIKASWTGNPTNWIIFRKSHNEVNNKIKNAKRSYYYKTFEACDGNSRKTWATVIEVTRHKSDKTVINEFELDGVKISNLAEISDAFNNDIEDVDVWL